MLVCDTAKTCFCWIEALQWRGRAAFHGAQRGNFQQSETIRRNAVDQLPERFAEIFGMLKHAYANDDVALTARSGGVARHGLLLARSAGPRLRTCRLRRDPRSLTIARRTGLDFGAAVCTRHIEYIIEHLTALSAGERQDTVDPFGTRPGRAIFRVCLDAACNAESATEALHDRYAIAPDGKQDKLLAFTVGTRRIIICRLTHSVSLNRIGTETHRAPLPYARGRLRPEWYAAPQRRTSHVMRVRLSIAGTKGLK